MSMGYRESTRVVPKLEGSLNYDAWQMLVSGTLQSSSAWKFIDGTAVPPVREPDEKMYQFQARLEAYQAQAAHARMIILST